MKIKSICTICGVEFIHQSCHKQTGKFCSRKCYFSEHRGTNHPSWKGGRVYDHFGYVLLKMPNHPNANNFGYVREHRLVMEKHLGRYLLKNEAVHHLNGVKDDNRIENLELCESNGKHSAMHHIVRDSFGRFSKESIC